MRFIIQQHWHNVHHNSNHHVQSPGNTPRPFKRITVIFRDFLLLGTATDTHTYNYGEKDAFCQPRLFIRLIVSGWQF